MKCNQSRSGFELVSPCSFPTAITITPWAPPKHYIICPTSLHTTAWKNEMLLFMMIIWIKFLISHFLILKIYGKWQIFLSFISFSVLFYYYIHIVHVCHSLLPPQSNNEFILTSLKYLAYLAYISRMVWEIGGKWQYNWCFAGCCFQDLFTTVYRILV